MRPRHVDRETERLLLCRPRLADVADLFSFLGDPDAMRFTTALGSVEGCRLHVARHERQRRRVGYAPWVVVERLSGRIAGYGGLYDDPFDPGWGVEAGYFFAPWAWGQGYASELTRERLSLAGRRSLDQVSAFAHPQNVASQRVLEKAGFEFERAVPEMNRRLYRWRPKP